MTEIRKFTKEERASFGFTVAELRQLAREHQVRMPSRVLHHELVAALKAAGVDLPAKPMERIKYPPDAPVERISRKPPAAGLTGGKLERYLYRDCALLALAVAERTGWPAVQIFGRGGDGEWTVRHALVQMPDGRLLDAAGPHRDYSGEELFDRRAWDLDIPGSEHLWRDRQVQRDAAALLALRHRWRS